MGLKPFTEEEIQKARVLPEGVYDFEVARAEDRVSKAGNEMIQVDLRVFAADNQVIVTDWLMADIRFAYKVRHFAAETGVMEDYDDGKLDASRCNGLAGRVQVKVEKSDKYGLQNRVKDYGSPDAWERKEPHKEAVGGHQKAAAIQAEL